jgi:hypothetical protein
MQPQVFNALEEHCDALARSAGHNAYIFECNHNNLKKWLNIMLLVVAHPEHRRPQAELLSLTPVDIATPSLTLSAPRPTPDNMGSSPPLHHLQHLQQQQQQRA